jgi:hypothetical protein
MSPAGRHYRYQVDRDGRMFHDGTEIVDPLTLRFFLRAMTRADDGRYLVVCQGERNWFDAYDTPFVVQRLRLVLDAATLRDAELCFQGDYREPLDPSGLQAGGGFVFCAVRGGRFRARFGRVAMQQIAPFIIEAPEGPVLLARGRQYPIRSMEAEGSG